MLILTRRDQEKILIGDDIEVVILGRKSGQVKIGIKAPDYVKILRSELLTRIAKETEEQKETELPKTVIKIKKSRLKVA